MTEQTTTNEQIYELLKELKTDFVQFKNDTHESFSDVRSDIRGLKRSQERLEDRTSRLEDKIDGIQVSWSNKLIAGTIGSSAAVSALVAFAISHVS